MYWSTSIRSFLNTTLPLLEAMFSPTVKASSSTRCGRPCRVVMSSKKYFAPWARLLPPVSKVLTATSGLVSAEFDGDSMSIMTRANWRVLRALKSSAAPASMRFSRYSSVASQFCSSV